MSTWAPWQGATNCTAGPTSGARALLAFLLEEYSQASSLGIYHCRSVRGSTTTSLHGEGRAVDLKWPMSSNGRGTVSGERVVERLGKQGARLGIQAVIYNRKIWSARSPSGRTYTGVHPHYDHHHIELTRKAGANLTLATLRAVLAETPPAPPPTSKEYEMKRGDKGAAVKLFQTCLINQASRNPLPKYGADGDFGAETEGAVKAYQGYAGVSQTGVIDGVTAALLLRFE